MIYSEANTYDDLVAKVNREEFKEESDSLQSFKFEVDARGKIMNREEQLYAMDMFTCLNFKGKVNLNKPDRIFMIIDNHYRGTKYFGKMIAGKSEGNLRIFILIFRWYSFLFKI